MKDSFRRWLVRAKVPQTFEQSESIEKSTLRPSALAMTTREFGGARPSGTIMHGQRQCCADLRIEQPKSYTPDLRVAPCQLVVLGPHVASHPFLMLG